MSVETDDFRRALLMYTQFLRKLGIVAEENGVQGFAMLFEQWACGGDGKFSDFVVREAARRLREDGRR